MSSRWVCELICQTVANCRETFAWYLKVLACITKLSQTVRQSFKHVILFCKEVSPICTMRQICDIRPFRDLIARNKTDQNSHERRETFERMSHDCHEMLARISHDCRETVTRMSHDCRTLVRQSHECLTTVLRQSRERVRTVVNIIEYML